MCYVFHVNIFASLTPIWTAGFIFPGSKNPCFGRVCIHPLRNCQRFETQVSPALYKVRKTPLGLLPWAELRMSNKIWETLSKNGWIRLLSHPGEASLLSLTERKMLAWISFCFSEGTSPRDTGVAENNCWARAFPTSVWAKYCLPRSHSFASPISLFLTGGNGCLRHGSNSRSLSCNGCQTRKGTPSPTECIQDPWESALCYMILSPCPYTQRNATAWSDILHTHTPHWLGTLTFTSRCHCTACLCTAGDDPLLPSTLSLLWDTEDPYGYEERCLQLWFLVPDVLVPG